MAGHLSNKTSYGKLRPYIRLNGFGDFIPGSVVFRTTPPKNGTWRQLGSINQCCGGTNDSYLVVQNNSTNGSNPGATVASVISSDGRINFNGTIAQSGGMMVFVIPGGIDEEITLTLAAAGSDGVDVTTSTISGDGTISAADPNFLTDPTFSTVFSTSATPNSQYLVILSND